MTGWALTFWGALLLLAYIYAGYPLLVAARARWFPRPVRRAPFAGGCSILIAARNEADNLPGKLASLLAQTAAGSIREILVGSDASTDRTAEVVRAMVDPRIQVVEFPEQRGKPSVLNDLMPLCSGEVVVMNDARQRLEPEALERLLAPFADPAIGVVSGELVFVDEWNSTASRGIDTYWRYEKWIRNSEGMVHSVPGATGALYAIRRSLLKPIPPQTILDDVAIPMQAVVAGARCIFEQGAVVYDKPSATAGQESIRKRRTIAGAAQLVGLYPGWLLPWRNPIWAAYISHKILRLGSPLLLLILLASNVMSLGGPVYYTMAAGQLGFYLAALTGWMLGRKGKRVRLFSIPLMFVTLNVVTLLALIDAVRGRYRVVWKRAYQP